MRPDEFHLNPAAYGLPSRQDLIALRIWDLHYHGTAQHEDVVYYADRMGIEHMISLDIAQTAQGRPQPRQEEVRDLAFLEKNRPRVSGIIRVDPTFPDQSLEKMESWVGQGPAIGIKFGHSNVGGIGADHPNCDRMVARAGELGGVIYIHSWTKIGGSPRVPGAGNSPGEATPMEVAALGSRFPNVNIICGHSGGDWELAIRAIRPYRNVCLEFAGSDPHSGQVDYAARELGVDRLIWGGHGPSRSYATELSKILDADLDRAGRIKVLGGNLRRLAAPIMRRKGWQIEV
jgi:uncharacterized protein